MTKRSSIWLTWIFGTLTVAGLLVAVAIIAGLVPVRRERDVVDGSEDQAMEIYLLDGVASSDVEAAEDLAALASKRQPEPIIGFDDILTYRAETHEMVVTEAASRRIVELDVPTSGRPFVVTVGGEPVYAGAFWTSFSSLSFDGPVIDALFIAGEANTVEIRLGYPGPSADLVDTDPRSDTRIISALADAGKLE